MIELWGMSSKWETRPSEFLGIDDSLDAYYFDSAVYYFGVEFEDDLEKALKTRGKKQDSEEMRNQKRERRLAIWLDDGTQEKQPRRFRDPNLERRG